VVAVASLPLGDADSPVRQPIYPDSRFFRGFSAPAGAGVRVLQAARCSQRVAQARWPPQAATAQGPSRTQRSATSLPVQQRPQAGCNTRPDPGSVTNPTHCDLLVSPSLSQHCASAALQVLWLLQASRWGRSQHSDHAAQSPYSPTLHPKGSLPLPVLGCGCCRLPSAASGCPKPDGRSEQPHSPKARAPPRPAARQLRATGLPVQQHPLPALFNEHNRAHPKHHRVA